MGIVSKKCFGNLSLGSWLNDMTCHLKLPHFVTWNTSIGLYAKGLIYFPDCVFRIRHEEQVIACL